MFTIVNSYGKYSLAPDTILGAGIARAGIEDEETFAARAAAKATAERAVADKLAAEKAASEKAAVDKAVAEKAAVELAAWHAAEKVRREEQERVEAATARINGRLAAIAEEQQAADAEFEVFRKGLLRMSKAEVVVQSEARRLETAGLEMRELAPQLRERVATEKEAADAGRREESAALSASLASAAGVAE